MTKEKITQPVDSTRPIYEGDCKKIKGDGRLKYEICQLMGPYQLRITDNTKAGTKNGGWRSAQKIDNAVTGRYNLTGAFLNDELNYKSRNTGGFILAALKDLGLIVKSSNGKYEHVPQSNFKNVVDRKIEKNRKIKK